MKLEKLLEFKEKKVAILWYWKEGKSSLDFLFRLGFKNITILDKNTNLEKKDDVNYILWEQYLDNLSDFSLIIKAPWVSPYNQKIAHFKEKLLTQTQIFSSNYKGKIIGVTWTKGKSTTSTLIHKTLTNIWYNTKLVGNIGTPVLDEIDIIKGNVYDFVVYELSSYMLEQLEIHPYIWVINNIYDCHLDWHEWKTNYTKAKINIIKNSKYKIVNYELKDLICNLENLKYFWENWNYSYNNLLFYKSKQALFKENNIKLEWVHNRKNICVIISILDIINPAKLANNLDILQSTLSSFSWLSHRLENIWTFKDIVFIDDAIATTPESTIAAIETYKQNIWTIFLWGQDSGFKFNKLKDILKKYNILNIVLFPDTWEKIFWDLSNYKYDSEFILDLDTYKPKILKTKSMKDAVSFAFQNTAKWKICLLSNAAPSYSLWSWYIEKWELFQKEVKSYI